jgi:type II secretory pathway component GspD/PulD (secretin)
MARKDIGRVLSGGAVILCIVLFYTDISVHAAFEAKPITYSISGSVGLSDVTMVGFLDGPVISNQNGFYSATVEHGWSGTVTPKKEGWNFEPVRRTYNKVTNDQTAQDYTATVMKFKISGTTGVEGAGAVMRGLPGDPVANAAGVYQATVDYGWSGTVTPTKEGYAFKPSSQTYTQVNSNRTNQNYVASVLTFTISGSTGTNGVVMKGLPGNPVTNGSGTYNAVVTYGWTGTVKPEKEGYTFDPPDRAYSNVSSARTNQSYIANPIKYVISGTTGMAGVVMKGLPNDPITDPSGSYSVVVNHGWTGTVRPTMDGYTFNPPSKTYSKVTEEQTNQNYSAELIKLTIAGTTGIGGVVMQGLPGEPISSEAGVYSATVDYGWSGTVTPQKEGYTFMPPSNEYSAITKDQTNDNYTQARITFVILGTTDISGVTMGGFPQRIVTGPGGTYSATVDYGWNGAVTPTKEGYTFDPSSRSYQDVASALPNENYTAQLLKRTISGRITSDKGPIQDIVVVADGGGGSVVTDANGGYEINVDYGWRGTVAPGKEGYTFTPPNRRYDPVKQDQPNQGYTANVVMFIVSGTIAAGGTGIEGVLITATPGGQSVTTDAEGKYSIKVPYGWTGEISPTKEGFSFDPPSESYTNITQNYKDGLPVATKTPPKPATPAALQQPVEPRYVEPSDVVPIVPGPMVQQATTPTQPFVDESEREKRRLEEQIRTLQQRYDQLSGEAADVEPVVPGMELLEPKIPDEELVTRVPGEPLIPKISEQEKGHLIRAVFVDVDLREALKEISHQSGVKIYADDTVRDTTVTCQLRDVTLEYALRRLLRGTDYAVKKIPHSYLVYSPISNVFVDTDLAEAIQTIASQANVSIIVEESVTGLVTCDLKSVPLETALEMVLAGTPYDVIKTADYYLVASGDIEAPSFSAVSETRRVKLNYVQANVAMSLLSTAFRNYVHADTETNAIVITAAPHLAKRIVADLKQIDKRPRHVMLDARIVVMERGDLLNLGVEWSWPHITAGTFGTDFRGGGTEDDDFGGRWPWGVQIGYAPDQTFTNALDLTLNLLAENGQADIMSNPQVLALDGRQAQIQVMTEEWYMMTAPEVTGLYYARAELQSITSGTTLTITPRIGDNNDITLDMSVEVSNSIPSGRGSDLPVVTRRTATNTVRVLDGGTVALAGLTENKESQKYKEVPGLGRLPIVGALFRNIDHDQSTHEVAVFVTARLVREGGEVTKQLAQPLAPPSYEAPTAPSTLTPTGPSAPTSPAPAGDEFKSTLRESLSRVRR